VIPVVEIDGRRIGTGVPGPVTAKLIDAFHKLVRA
jgi:branched-chain amino acid aminotransferase